MVQFSDSFSLWYKNKRRRKKRSFVKAKFSYRFRLWHYEKRRKRKKKGEIVCQCVVFLPFLFGTMRKKPGFRQGAVFLQFLFVVLCEKKYLPIGIRQGAVSLQFVFMLLGDEVILITFCILKTE